MRSEQACDVCKEHVTLIQTWTSEWSAGYWLLGSEAQVWGRRNLICASTLPVCEMFPLSVTGTQTHRLLFTTCSSHLKQVKRSLAGHRTERRFKELCVSEERFCSCSVLLIDPWLCLKAAGWIHCCLPRFQVNPPPPLSPRWTARAFTFVLIQRSKVRHFLLLSYFRILWEICRTFDHLHCYPDMCLCVSVCHV